MVLLVWTNFCHSMWWNGGESIRIGFKTPTTHFFSAIYRGPTTPQLVWSILLPIHCRSNCRTLDLDLVSWILQQKRGVVGRCLVGGRIGLSVGCLVGWLVDWLVWLVGFCLFGWFVCWLLWLVGLLVVSGSFIHQFQGQPVHQNSTRNTASRFPLCFWLWENVPKNSRYEKTHMKWKADLTTITLTDKRKHSR